MSKMNNLHALIIGISNYQHLKPPLPRTILKDAQDIYDLLIDPNHCGYLPDNVQLLRDGEATQAALHQKLADLALRTNKDSTVFIYFSGHGGRIRSGSQRGAYLLPVDTLFKSSQSIAQTAISGAELTTALRAIPARKMVIVFDCCHAGGIGQPKSTTAPIFKNGLPESYYETLNSGRGCVILASSRSTELSWLLPAASNSLFTQHLLAGLRGGIASEDGLIRIFDLFEYIQPRVTADKPNQHPVFKANLEENFPVALYLGGQKGVIAKDEAGFRYDVYISYVDQEPDATWVWDKLLPYFEKAGLRVAISGDVETRGVARVVGIERAIKQCKRTMIVLSPAYLADQMADFQNVLAQTLGINENSYRLLPVKIAPIDEAQLPTRLRMLGPINLIHPRRAKREFKRLIKTLQDPLPKRLS